MKLEGRLNSDDIARITESAALELERAGIEPGMRLRFRIALEEFLIIYREAPGQEGSFTLKIRKSKGEMKVTLAIPGAAEDPYTKESPLLDRTLEGFLNKPEWRYEKDSNLISFAFILYNSMRRNYAFAGQYVKKHRGMMAVAVLAQLLSIFLGIVAPIVSARIVVRYMDNQALQVITMALSLLVIQLVKNLCTIVCNMGYNRVYSATLSDLEGDLMMGALTIKNKCMDEKGSGLFIQRLTVDTSRLAMGFGRIADMIAQAINYVGILIAMLAISPAIFGLALFLIIIQSLMEMWRTKRLCRDDRLYRTANEKFSGFVGEMVRGARDIKQLSSEDAFCVEARERIVNANDKRLTMQKHSWRLKFLRWDVSDIGTYVFLVLLALSLEWKFLAPTAVMVLYNYYSNLDGRAVTLAGELLEFVKDFNLSVERVCALMTSPEFPKEQFGSKKLTDPKGEIVFDRVSFGYGGDDPKVKKNMVLDEMSFTVKAGEMVALVGKSGCGKSTVLNLLCRLYDPDSGRILFDGEDTRTLTKESLRNNITMVSQAPYIFNMSVRENLRIAKNDMTDEEMRQVCALACIDEDIEAMPEGYDSIIGEGGVNLSGGQRQRLAIARGLLKDYKIILFDEATSALDNLTQSKIQKAIENIGEDRTIILIAHRLSTVIHADRIMYMEDGKILDQGSHQELLERCQPYRVLYKEEAGAK